MYKNSQLNIFKNIKLVGEISNNWPNNLLGTNLDNTLKSCWSLLLALLQWIYTSSRTYKWDTFSPFLSLVILLLLLPTNQALKVWDVNLF